MQYKTIYNNEQDVMLNRGISSLGLEFWILGLEHRVFDLSLLGFGMWGWVFVV